MNTFIKHLFAPDYEKYEGIARYKIYLLRIVFGLTFLSVGFDSWSYILSHEGPWPPLEGVAFCVWASYSTLSLLGVFHTVKMLPLMLFQISYKLVWLGVVALPLVISGTLTGSRAEPMTYVFMIVLLPIVAMPWKYVYNNFFKVKCSRD